MKKKFVILMILVILCVSGCAVPTDKVLDSLGEYSKEDYFLNGGFQDYTIYAKYTYEDVNIDDNKYFEKVSYENKQKLSEHIEDFEDWIESIEFSEPESEIILGYDFDISIISDDDYLYIYDDPDYPKPGNYDVYFLDMETMTLYYFHNNI